MPKKTGTNRYVAIIDAIFRKRYHNGMDEVPFDRVDLFKEAKRLKIEMPKNAGDLVYSFRYRNEFPSTITKTAPDGQEWIILPAGRARYKFALVKKGAIVPQKDRLAVKVPDSTPEIIAAYAQGDEQALLAKVRYNRLIDLFLGLTTYSLQNHMRTTVKGMGQIEIDELYVGLDRYGRQFVIPVQAKGGNDRHSSIQTLQDYSCCRQKFPDLICRPVSAQFGEDELIALFELAVVDDEVKVVDERHYKLVPAENIVAQDLAIYANLAKD